MSDKALNAKLVIPRGIIRLLWNSCTDVVLSRLTVAFCL